MLEGLVSGGMVPVATLGGTGSVEVVRVEIVLGGMDCVVGPKNSLSCPAVLVPRPRPRPLPPPRPRAKRVSENMG